MVLHFQLIRHYSASITVALQGKLVILSLCELSVKNLSFGPITVSQPSLLKHGCCGYKVGGQSLVLSEREWEINFINKVVIFKGHPL